MGSPVALRMRRGQVDGDRRAADAALAADDGERAGRASLLRDRTRHALDRGVEIRRRDRLGQPFGDAQPHRLEHGGGIERLGEHDEAGGRELRASAPPGRAAAPPARECRRGTRRALRARGWTLPTSATDVSCDAVAPGAQRHQELAVGRFDERDGQGHGVYLTRMMLTTNDDAGRPPRAAVRCRRDMASDTPIDVVALHAVDEEPDDSLTIT